MPSGPTRSPLRPRAKYGALVAFVLAGTIPFAWAQIQALPRSEAPSQPQVQVPVRAAPASASRPALAASAAKARQRTKPLWVELAPAQQQALAPLATKWDTLSETQKRKWLALSQNFPKMSGAEQAKLHSRMTEWVALSPQQRTQARLNFGKTQQLSPDDKKAKWEAYQALSPEEKGKLAARAAKPPATAAAVKPVAPEKLAVVPKTARRPAAPRVATAPIAAAPPPSSMLPASSPAAPSAAPVN